MRHITDRQITAIIDNETVDRWNTLLTETRRVDGGENLDGFNFDFGEDYEVLLKLCNGEDGPYIDAVLFQNGSEVACLEPGFEQIEGTYQFEFGHLAAESKLRLVILKERLF